MWLIMPAMAGENYCFRLYLKDKGVPETAVTSPETFLSAEAVERRTKRNVEITLSDVPIASSHIELITATGVRVVTQSKWLASVVVESEDSLSVERLKALPMVDSVLCVWQGSDRLTPTECSEDTSVLTPDCDRSTETYGYGASQLNMLNGMRLHDAGRKGQGIRIAVIDAGFLHVDRISAFASLRLLGTHNPVFPGHSVFCEDDHGTKVLSCLGANLPGVMIGAAPEASYLLIKSEDTRSEFPVEEDYWAAAIEYADSMGVDIVSSSLGYYRFDSADTLYTPSDLDGRTAFITRVAQAAADKGMLVFCSAGNEGRHEWEKITFPADAPDVLTVGAIAEDEQLSSFSSRGFTADYRIKPDVVALGSGVCVIDADGTLRHTNGTSFSTPIVAGLGACLWQALPWLDNRELIALIRRTASQAEQPDAERGYGIPDMYKAYIHELNEPVQ
ncbi:MAG: S8 family serine peptidase [Tannerella sp.]|jgi:subtilisin family serine protease|nr:S8 family serine peptidase [Tannerella sp.]